MYHLRARTICIHHSVRIQVSHCIAYPTMQSTRSFRAIRTSRHFQAYFNGNDISATTPKQFSSNGRHIFQNQKPQRMAATSATRRSKKGKGRMERRKKRAHTHTHNPKPKILTILNTAIRCRMLCTVTFFPRAITSSHFGERFSRAVFINSHTTFTSENKSRRKIEPRL